MRMDLLLEDVEVVQSVGDVASVEVTSVELDSRHVGPGALFCCLPGSTTDGHAFASDAIGRGAVALLSERPLEVDVPQVIVRQGQARSAMAHAAATLEGHPAASLEVIGVTGTNGKTTVTHLLGAILEANGTPTAIVGTLDGERTTPEAPVLQHLLAEARDIGQKAVAMEVSSHALSQARVDAMRFRAAVFTNLGQDHLDYHKTMEQYFEAKADLFRAGTRRPGDRERRRPVGTATDRERLDPHDRVLPLRDLECRGRAAPHCFLLAGRAGADVSHRVVQRGQRALRSDMRSRRSVCPRTSLFQALAQHLLSRADSKSSTSPAPSPSSSTTRTPPTVLRPP